MTRTNDQATSWLTSVRENIATPSPLGRNVAGLLEEMWGIHNTPFKRGFTDWNNDTWIEVVLNSPQLATVDYNRLTTLVVRSHARMLRVELEPRSRTSILLRFHQRSKRSGRLHERCPTMLDHVKIIDDAFGDPAP